jgi:hypothetical protein
VRDGTGYHSWNYLEATLEPSEVAAETTTGQLAQLRKFDEADRTRHEVKGLAQLIPRDDLDVSFTGAWSQNDYPHSSYGLRGDERWNVGTELGYQPFERLSLSAWYSFEHIEQNQRSRWRPVSGVTVTDDPVNDWTSDSIDEIHAVGASIDLVIVPDRFDVNLSYTLERGTGQTHSDEAAGCLAAPVTLPCLPALGGTADGGNATDAPDLEDHLQILATTFHFQLSEHFSFEAMYAWQKLSLQDFHVDGLTPYMPLSNVNGSGVVSPSLDVFLGERLGDYNAHVVTFGATYEF